MKTIPMTVIVFGFESNGEEIRKAMERMDLERLKLLLVTALEWAKK